jgi:hypothetical protein
MVFATVEDDSVHRGDHIPETMGQGEERFFKEKW